MADVERVLVVGSGGREAAIMAQAIDEGVNQVYSTRGEDAINIGLEGVINTGLGEADLSAIGSFASQEEIDLVVVGPELPLINGIGDALRSRGITVFGPNADGAQFEANKVFTHGFAEKYDLPNPDNSVSFTSDRREEAKSMIRELGPEKVVTKRVGPEGGKGATTYNEDELQAALDEVDAVADKGEELLIQGRLLGPEYSATFMLDGKGNSVATVLSRDHKALYDGGLGPNTGGMGAVAPLSFEQARTHRRERIEEIGMLTANGLLEEGIDYRGVIYAGLMAETEDPDSELKLLEFNVRFGDPETQVIIQKLGGQALEYMYAAAKGSLDTDMKRIYFGAGSCVDLTVALASPGYATGDVTTGLPIHVPEELPEGVSIQFAGAKMVDGAPVSSGGRVAYITKRGMNLDDARTVYDHIGLANNGLAIGDDQQVIRTDIGLV